MKIVSFLAFFMLIVRCSASNESSVISINNVNQLLTIGKNISYFEDSAGLKTIKDIQTNTIQNKFIHYDKDVFATRASKSAFWFKFNVQNTTNEDLWLELESIFVWYLDFYSPTDTGFTVFKTGLMRPKENKYFDINLYWLPLNKANDQSIKTYYVRLTEEEASVEAPFNVGTIRSLMCYKNKRDNVTAAFIGIVFIMILYHSFLFFSTKNVNYIFYIFYLFFSLITNTYLAYYPIVEVLFPFIPSMWWYKYFIVWVGFNFLFTGYFCVKYLQLRERFRVAYFLIFFEIVLLSFVFPLLNSCIFDIITLAESYQVVIFIFYITCFSASVYMYYKKFSEAKYFILGWTFMILSIFCYISVVNGLITFNFYTHNVMYFGMTMEIWMFSLALGENLNTYRKEKEIAQLQLVNELEEKKHILANQNSYLKNVVNEKTKDLESTIHELNAINEELTITVETIQKQNETIQFQQNEIKLINENLEELIKKRTQQLIEQNKDLAQYAFMNAHDVRGPLARILGLLLVLKLEQEKKGIVNFQYIDLLHKNAHELDSVIKKMNKILEQSSIEDVS